MRSKIPSSTGLVHRGPPIAMCVAVAIGIILAMTGSAYALSTADLPLGSIPRYHPDPDDILKLWDREFFVYTGAALPAAWTLQDSLSVDFHNGVMYGTLDSQVWQHTDGHTLFAYQLDNTGDQFIANPCEMRTGNIDGFAAGWEFQDVGLLDYNGDVNFDDGDVLKMEHSLDTMGTEQFAFFFETTNREFGVTEEWLLPGETSTWFYFETDATAWQTGIASVQNGGSSASAIPVLVPAPEPVTVLGVLIGIGTLGGYIRRRRIG